MNNNLPERKRLKLQIEVQEKYERVLLEAAAIVVNNAQSHGEQYEDYEFVTRDAWLLIEEIGKVANIKAIEAVELIDEAYAEVMLEES